MSRQLPISGDLAGAALMALYFGVLLGGVEFWTRRRQPAPESSRKLVHVGGGFGAALFPFAVSSIAVVALLAAGFTLLIWAGGRWRFLQSVSRVERKSRGGEYFPVAVALLFWVSQGRLWLYFAGLLILTLADTAAALVGGRFGRRRYRVGPADWKSTEGSIAFWVVACLVICACLFTFSGLALRVCLGVALLTATLLTFMEAVAVRGTDNLLVPLLTCYVLGKITTKPAGEIWFQVESLAGLCLALLCVNRALRALSPRDFLFLCLFVYSCWSLGSVSWAAPALGGFAAFCAVRAVGDRDISEGAGTPVVLHALLVPMAILAVANWTNTYDVSFGPFLAAICAVLLIGLVHYAEMGKPWGSLPFGRLLLLWAVAGLLVVAPVALVDAAGFSPSGAALVPGLALVAAVVHQRIAAQLIVRRGWLSPPRLVLYLGVLAAAAYLLAQNIGATLPWSVRS